MGIKTKRIQWVAFTFAGINGGARRRLLFVFSKGTSFQRALNRTQALTALIVVFLGGVKTLAGGLVGGAFFGRRQDLPDAVSNTGALALGFADHLCS